MSSDIGIKVRRGRLRQYQNNFIFGKKIFIFYNRQNKIKNQLKERKKERKKERRILGK